MELTGIHILLTYQCVLECDHCFVWGSPWQSGTFTLRQLQNVLDQAAGLGTVEWIYYEGGEPFLYYALLLQGVQRAAAAGSKVGIVTNGYWATTDEDALEWLRPMAGLVQDLSISSDLFHWSDENEQHARSAVKAANELGIPVGTISIARAEAFMTSGATGQIPAGQIPTGQIPFGESGVMFRGRAAEKLVGRVEHQPWSTFTACPHEDLREPGRVHLDPLGNLHVCQGILMGNLFEQPLAQLCAAYNPENHPIFGPLLENGPVGLVEAYGLDELRDKDYADACHLCYKARLSLRQRFPELLAPDQVYGIL